MDYKMSQAEHHMRELTLPDDGDKNDATTASLLQKGAD
jgi:hypothetical protein